MPSNLGFTMTIKANDGTLVPLYPKTTKDQVLGWNIGESYGPYQFTLDAAEWSNNQQTVSLDGVMPTDILICTKVLTGAQEEMTAQDKAYSLLNARTGIESLQNQIRFTCDSTPNADFTVSVSWTR